MIQPDMRGVPMHVHAIKESLTRNLDSIIPDMFDEIRHAFEDLIPAVENGAGNSTILAGLLTMCRVVVCHRLSYHHGNRRQGQ